MKPNPEPTEKLREAEAAGSNARTQPADDSGTSPEADVPAHFRRLNPNEMASRGDYVVNPQGEFEPWVGLSGFRAGSFVQPIYRQDKSRPITTKEPK
jgi:hypothetical protein